MLNYEIENIDLAQWDILIKKTNALRIKICCECVDIVKVSEHLFKLAKDKKLTPQKIQTKDEASVLINLWLTNADFCKLIPYNNEYLTQIITIHNDFISTFMLYNLIELYFHFYNTLETNAPILIKRLKKEINSKYSKNKDENLRVFVKQGSFLLDSSFRSHETIVGLALRDNCSLSKVMNSFGLNPNTIGKFYEKCRHLHYIKRIENNELSSIKPILDEIYIDEIYQKDFENNYNLGHKVIEILLNRLSNKIFDIKEYKFIIDFILKIAEDPRISKTSIKYQKWWNVLGEDNISKMMKYLSGFDLSLFLEIYEEFSKDNHLNDAQRMFKDRKNFLQGMLENDLIHETKLFIGKEMKSYLINNYANNKLPQHFYITDNSRMAVIYMRHKNMLFTEGAFNCTFRAYNHINEKNPFYSTKKDYTYRELGVGLLEKYSTNDKFEKTHQGDWQSSIISYFKRNIMPNLSIIAFYHGHKAIKYTNTFPWRK